MGLDGGIIDSVQQSLSLSALSTLELRGGKCGFRLEDEHVGVVASCLQQAGADVITLSLTYHNITGAGVEYISRSLLGGIATTDSIKLTKLNLEEMKSGRMACATYSCIIVVFVPFSQYVWESTWWGRRYGDCRLHED